ncbi:hypothetical protein C2W62_21125 [Candidatus Entotheonella serta]|nr:hypothetical protein C2W62_21125 [Candidatus Entotheonella serta]
MALSYLSERDVATYLQQRFVSTSVPASLAAQLHQRTQGNPFFLVTIVDTLVETGALGNAEFQGRLNEPLDALELSIPDSIRVLIDHQLERLQTRDRELLEAASVAGQSFSAPAVAACVSGDVETAERGLDALVQRQDFILAQGMEVWPDGTYAMSYAFIHALYQEVVYSQVSASRKARWHQQIGVAKEMSYGPQAVDIAAELSTHFLRARDGHRAIGYLHQAGTNAMRRHAYQEGIDLLRQGLDALALFPDVTERLEPELTLQLTLGGALIAAKGYAAPEVEIAYERARQLCGQIGANPRLLRVQLGLAAYYFSRAALETATELGEQCVSLAQRDGAPAHLVQAHYALGSALMFRGQFAQAQDHFDQGIALYEPSHHQPRAL